MGDVKNLLETYARLSYIGSSLSSLVESLVFKGYEEIAKEVYYVEDQIIRWVQQLFNFEPDLLKIEPTDLSVVLKEDFEVEDFELSERLLKFNYSVSYYGFLKLKGNLKNLKDLLKSNNLDESDLDLLISQSQNLINLMKSEIN